MAYEKRLCILKQVKKGFTADGAPLTGAVYAERLGTELVVTPRIAGLAPLSEGKYVLCIGAGGKRYFAELGGKDGIRFADAPTIGGGFSALLCFVRGEAEPVAFGRCGEEADDYAPLLAALSEGERKRPIPVPMPPNQIPGAPSPQVPLAPAVPLPEEDGEPFRDAAAAKYDDEAIASSDFYRTSAAGSNEETAFKGPPQENGERSDENEPAVYPFRLSRGGLTYYNGIAQKLKEAFLKYPADETLSAAIPHSEWVKTERALLGVVYGEGVPRYLCVAIREEPPEEAKNASVFVPVGPYDEDDGYYVVFQDADTGDYVRVEKD